MRMRPRNRLRKQLVSARIGVIILYYLLDEYLKGAKDTFVKDAVFLESREQFEDYMRVMENQFYETVHLPKSPYVDAKRQEGQLLPTFPPQAFGFGQNEPSVERGKRIDK